jgi:hypothetical protein
MQEEIKRIGYYCDNSLSKGFQELDIYGEEATQEKIRCILTDETTRNDIRTHQLTYVNRLKALGDIETVLGSLVK